MSRTIRFLSGTILGGFVFAAAVLLLAPSNGKAVRARVTSFFANISAEVNQAAAQRRAELEQELAALRLPQTRN
jgi:gas vesicle protein